MVTIQALAEHDWHSLTTDDVVDLLDADDEQGLDLFEVKHRLEKVGPNVITPARARAPGCASSRSSTSRWSTS